MGLIESFTEEVVFELILPERVRGGCARDQPPGSASRRGLGRGAVGGCSGSWGPGGPRRAHGEGQMDAGVPGGQRRGLGPPAPGARFWAWPLLCVDTEAGWGPSQMGLEERPCGPRKCAGTGLQPWARVEAFSYPALPLQLEKYVGFHNYPNRMSIVPVECLISKNDGICFFQPHRGTAPSVLPESSAWN